MDDILQLARKEFHKTMQKQNFEWAMIDGGMIEEEKPLKSKTFKPKKTIEQQSSELKHKPKGRHFF